MSKARIALAAICLFAGVGGAMAFKARAKAGFIIVNGTRVPVTTQANCTTGATGCTYLLPAGPYQLYTTTGGSNIPVPLKTTL